MSGGSSRRRINALIDNINGLYNRSLSEQSSSVYELEMRGALLEKYGGEASHISRSLTKPQRCSAWLEEKKATMEKVNGRLAVLQLEWVQNVEDGTSTMLSEMNEYKQNLVTRTLAAARDIDCDDREFGESSIGRQGSLCSDACSEYDLYD